MVGRSQLKARVIDQMLVSILNNATIHFASRFRKYTIHLGVEKKDSARVVGDAFKGRWDLVPESVRMPLREILPERVDSNNVHIDLKKFPSKYVGATYRLSRAMPDSDICFAPLRRSCIPCHVKLDTEALAQIFVPYKKAVEARKAAGTSNRMNYNDWVWGHVLNRRVVDGKSRKYRFHHEIMTDGVAVSLLYAREEIQTVPTLDAYGKNKVQKGQAADEATSSIPPSQKVGLDPGKKNVATMIDSRGVSLKYSARQRAFESKLCRYKRVLLKEKIAAGIETLETELSKFSHRSNHFGEFLLYLEAKRAFDRKAEKFYNQEKWRGWKFRLFCNRKSSEARFVNKVASTYGEKCLKLVKTGTNPRLSAISHSWPA